MYEVSSDAAYAGDKLGKASFCGHTVNYETGELFCCIWQSSTV
jgi:hypothetical protein